MVRSIYKKPTPGLKNHMRNLCNFKQAVESPKSWRLMGYCYPKSTFLQLKYIQRIYPTLLSTSCVKSHQMTHIIYAIFMLKHYILSTKVAYESENFQTCQCLHWNSLNSSCHFWNQGSAFLRTLHHSSVSWDLLFCTFSSKYLYALDKRIGSKCKLLDFRLLEWKLTKFLMSFFKPQINFPLNFASPFSVMIHNSSEIF